MGLVPGGRAREQLHRWADENGYRLLAAERRYLSLRFFPRGKYQRVFRIEAVDPEGHTRTGWALVGDWWLGSLAYRVKVRWDE